jgi:hypothetical protein
VPATKSDILPDARWSILMKTAILAVLVALSLGATIANAEPLNDAAPPQSGSQYNWTAGAPGWG